MERPPGSMSAVADPGATRAPEMPWHQAGFEQVAAHWRTDPRKGLSTHEAAQRLAQHGPNEIAVGGTTGPWRLLLDQFRDLMIVILLVAAVVAGVIGDLADTIVILVIVVLNALIGFVQTYRAERAIAALRALAALHARVLRDGTARQVAAADLVPGDVVLLDAGAAVPADMRLAEVAHLRVEEAALTGESLPVDKQAGVLDAADLVLGDRRNMAYKGTVVSAGRAQGIVVATGTRTELGRIADLLRRQEDVQTPLQKRLARFGKVLSLAVLAICALLFVAGLLRGEPVMLMALTAISLAVAAIPEALPAVVTMSLALGARRMVANHVLIRKLPAVETLGSVTYICSDKTGTLTLNRMHVECMWTPDRGPCAAHDAAAAQHLAMQRLLLAMAVSNDAQADAGGEIAGDPTEVALYLAAREAGCAKAQQDIPRVAETPSTARVRA
jgi:Ca2+-transporting ATPase